MKTFDEWADEREMGNSVRWYRLIADIKDIKIPYRYTLKEIYNAGAENAQAEIKALREKPAEPQTRGAKDRNLLKQLKEILDAIDI